MFKKKNKPEEKKGGPKAKKEEKKDKPKAQPNAPAVEPSKVQAAQPQIEKTPPPGAAQPRPQPQQVQFDEAELVSCYANFCRVTGTPEEVILDLGLNPQAIGAPGDNAKVSQRVIVNYFTAKRMLAALHVTVSRHEQAFGPIETDVQKRATPAAAPAAT